MRTAVMRLFIAEHLPSKREEWVQRALRWTRVPKTVEDLVGAIYRYEDASPANEIAIFYSGSWIVWKAQVVELQDVFAEEAERFVDVLRSRLFCDDPGDDEFEKLEGFLRSTLQSRAAVALEKGKLPRSLKRVAVMEGTEPVGRFVLTPEDILAGAPG